MTLPFGTVGICGVGLIGGSLGLALKNRNAARRVIGIGRNERKLVRAKELGAIDDYALDLSQAAPELDVLVLATPVGIMANLLAPAAENLKSECIVTDAGSTKADLVRRMQDILKGRARFVGSHPMAGSEKTGCESAEADLYQDATCIVTPTPETDEDALLAVESLWRAVGCRIVRLNPADHDCCIARTSHLPHLAAAALVRVIGQCNPDKIRELIGDGFRDTTRVAAGDPTMWRDICIDNTAEIAASLTRFEEELRSLRAMVESGDAAALQTFLEQAQKERQAFD